MKKLTGKDSCVKSVIEEIDAEYKRDILPCPFCRSDRVRVCAEFGMWVECFKCGARGPSVVIYNVDDDNEAILVWGQAPRGDNPKVFEYREVQMPLREHLMPTLEVHGKYGWQVVHIQGSLMLLMREVQS